MDHNAAYIIFSESLLSNLVRSQAIDVIVKLRKQINVKKYYLIAFLTWDQYFRKRKKTFEMIKVLKKKKIICKAIPIPFPIPFPIYSFKNGWKLEITYNVFTVPLVMLLTLPTILFFKIFLRIRLFHCRSYISSLPILLIKLLSKRTIFIFDPRSDYPEETALRKRWYKSGINFRMWKYLEKLYYIHSDVVIAIGERFAEHIKCINDSTKSINIYNNVDTDKFVFDEKFRKEYRTSNNIDDKILFVYSGTLYENHWNDPNLYVNFIVRYFNLDDFQALFLFLIPKYCHKILLKILKQSNINLKLCLIESPSYTDIHKYLSAADIATYFLPYYSPRVGTKFVEYCSIGLPTLVNNNVGGTTELIKKFKLGYSLNNQECSNQNVIVNIKSINIFQKLIHEKEDYRRRCRKFAEHNFNNSIIINKYESVYQKLL